MDDFEKLANPNKMEIAIENPLIYETIPRIDDSKTDSR